MAEQFSDLLRAALHAGDDADVASIETRLPARGGLKVGESILGEGIDILDNVAAVALYSGHGQVCVSRNLIDIRLTPRRPGWRRTRRAGCRMLQAWLRAMIWMRDLLTQLLWCCFWMKRVAIDGASRVEEYGVWRK